MIRMFRAGSGKDALWLSRRILRDGLLMGLMVLLLEALLSTVADEYRGHVYDHEFTGGFPIAMNEDGHRGAPIEPEKEPGAYRILALGDSVTFGTGVAGGDTWPHRLQEIMARARSGNVRSINAALPGVRLRDLTHTYTEKWAAYSPDVVVVALSNNLVSQAWIGRESEPTWPSNEYLSSERRGGLSEIAGVLKRFTQKCATPRFLKVNVERATYWIGLRGHRINPDAPFGPLLAMGWRQSDLPEGRAELAWSHLESDLSRLKEETQRRNTPLCGVYVPARFMISDSCFDNEKRVIKERLTLDPADRSREICARLGIPFLDATDPIRDQRAILAEERGAVPSMYIQFDFSHLDRDGHEALAKALGRMLVGGD